MGNVLGDGFKLQVVNPRGGFLCSTVQKCCSVRMLQDQHNVLLSLQVVPNPGHFVPNGVNTRAARYGSMPSIFLRIYNLAYIMLLQAVLWQQLAFVLCSTASSRSHDSPAPSHVIANLVNFLVEPLAP